MSDKKVFVIFMCIDYDLSLLNSIPSWSTLLSEEASVSEATWGWGKNLQKQG